MAGNKKTALITGAAGDIGSDVARRFDALGYQLILVDIDKDKLKTLVSEMQEANGVAVNLTNREELAVLVKDVCENYGPIDVAFVNAAMIAVGNMLDLDENQIDLQIELNLRSAIHLIKACAHNMVENKSGHIISTVSMGGIVAMKGSATYSATKFGLRGFMTSIRDELHPLGVYVSGVFPSGVDTQMLRYEAENNGSPLNFVSTPQTVQAVGDKVMKALKGKRLEYYVPFSDSVTSRIVSCFPWLIRYLYPLMERLGERGRTKYLNTKRHSA